jgi:hypothetical protein
MPFNVSDVIAFNHIHSGDAYAGIAGNGGSISGPVVNVPINTTTPINVALGGSATQTVASSSDQHQDLTAGNGGNGGNWAHAESGDVAVVPIHDVAAANFHDFVHF